MSTPADRMREWLDAHGVDAQLLQFETTVYSVEEAVAASGLPVERFTKSMVMVTSDGQGIIAMVRADCRASTDRVRKALGLADRPRLATAQETLDLTGQQAGGNSPLNPGRATVLIDPKVMEQDWLVTGGGDDRSLVRISTDELRRVANFTEIRVRK
jgi:prolyl-tRNA editing enzyme YbaK/EbsC (Cys-tRNA(Pro) deacylase)